MDFIERIFGISPDSGSGLLEWLLAMILFVVLSCRPQPGETRNLVPKR
jgi:hypothetical protein